MVAAVATAATEGREVVRSSTMTDAKDETSADDDEVVEAVALLRVRDGELPEDADVRFLDDGALVFLPIDFDSDEQSLLEELALHVGDAIDDHHDERGVFFLPDFAEPEDAKTYEAVIAAVGDDGRWIALEPAAPTDLAGMLGENAEAMIGRAFEAMGISDPKAFMQAMQSGDPEAMKLAQIHMQGKLDEAMRAAHESHEEEKESDDAPPKPKT
jgi:hypothetical protein